VFSGETTSWGGFFWALRLLGKLFVNEELIILNRNGDEIS